MSIFEELSLTAKSRIDELNTGVYIQTSQIGGSRKTISP
jgi:hypothetical protein